MAGENYTNTASVATTAAPIGPSDTSVTLANFSGYPAAPFWGEFEKGTTSAELVRVTNVAGSILTITRGEGGTSATSHGAGVNFELVAPADFYNRTEAHMSATNAHGVTGNVVGTSGSQTLQDKTYRGAHRSLFSDTLPAGVTASYESVADNASARDGFVHKNTAGDAARSAFLAQQSGVDRFKVSNTGNVTITPSAGVALTVDGDAAVTGDQTVGGTLDVTGAATLSGGVDTSTVTASGAVSGASVTSSGAVTGLSASILGAVHAGGDLDTDGTLVVDGTSTLTGAVSAGSGLTVVQGIGSWNGRVPVSVSGISLVTTPATGDVAYARDERIWKRWDGAAWVDMFASDTATNSHEASYEQAGQSIPPSTPRAISWSTIILSSTGDISLSAGGPGAVANGVITFNRGGLWDISVTVKNPVAPSGGSVQALRMRQPDDTGAIVLGDGGNNCPHDCGVVRITAGTQYSVIYVQQSGSTQNCSASFRAVWLRG